MREFAKISPQIWTNELGRKIKQLGLEERVLSFYFLTNPYANMAGIYYLPIIMMAHETGMSCEQVSEALTNLCEIGFCSYDSEYEYVWVHDMAIDQVSAQLKPNDNRVKAINTIYASLPALAFLRSFYDKYSGAFFLNDIHGFYGSSEDPLNPLRSKEKKKENENKNEKKTFLSGTPDIVDEEKLHSDQKNETQIERFRLAATYLSQANEILDFLNQKTKRKFRAEDSNLRLIVSRLKSGVTADECRAVIARKYRDWNEDEKMKKFLRPATLFNPAKFEQYLGDCVEDDGYQDENAAEEGLMDAVK